MTTDSVYFVRNPQCNNHNAGTPPTTPAPGPPPLTNKPNPLEVRLLYLPALMFARQRHQGNCHSNTARRQHRFHVMRAHAILLDPQQEDGQRDCLISVSM